MAVTRGAAFRAVLTSHAQITRNRLARELGRFHFIATLVIVVFIATTSIVPIAGATSLLGYYGAKRIFDPVAQAWIGTLLFLLSIGGGLMSGGMGGSRQLAWETYRVYPVRHGSLIAAELIASVLEVVPLFFVTVILATVCGMAVARPSTIPVLLVVAFEAILSLLLARMIVASFAAAIVRRLRVAVTVVVLVIVAAPLLGTVPPASGAPSSSSPGSDAFVHTPSAREVTVNTSEMVTRRHAFERVAAWLPTTAGARSVAMAVKGDALEALACHVYPLALLGIALIAASRLVAREVASGGVTPQGAHRKLWSFRSPIVGVARVTWQTLLDSAIGRFGLVVPILTLVLVKWPLSQFLGWGSSSTPAAYAYVALSTSAIQLNQFGLDGHGIKALLLLPLSSSDILRGKSLGLGVYSGAQVASLALLVVVVQRAPIADAVAGALLGMSLLVFQNMIGRWTSSWMPRRLPRRDMRSTSGPGALVLVALGLTATAGSVFGGVYVACSLEAPSLLVPAMLAVLVVTLVAHRLTRDSAVRYFERRREHVVHAIG